MEWKPFLIWKMNFRPIRSRWRPEEGRNEKKKQIKIISKLEQMGGNVWYWKKRSSEKERNDEKNIYIIQNVRAVVVGAVCADHGRKESRPRAAAAKRREKKEQQFGIFIYCNVILESFFISVGWILNENVDGRGNIWRREVTTVRREERARNMRELSVLFRVWMWMLSSRIVRSDRTTSKFNSEKWTQYPQEVENFFLHLICYSEFDWIRDIFHNPKSNFMLSGATRSHSYSCHFISFTALLRIWQMAEFPPQISPRTRIGLKTTRIKATSQMREL